MNPLARELNEQIESQSPETFALLSRRGKDLYFPRGILSQTAEANEKAHLYNATIGEATEGDEPMALASILSHLHQIDAADVVRYAPAAGKPELRRAWREKLLRENPLLRGSVLGLPIVTSAITHGLSLVGDLFVDDGDRILLSDKLWENYRLTYEVRLGARVETFPTYAGNGFNVGGLAEALRGGPEKTLLLLNFPNNPTGYMQRPYLGIRLFELGGRLKPAYVDRVRPRSPAKKAGVRKNDLIVAIDGELIATCSDYHQRLSLLEPGREIQITVKRKSELKTIMVTVGTKTQVKRP